MLPLVVDVPNEAEGSLDGSKSNCKGAFAGGFKDCVKEVGGGPAVWVAIAGGCACASGLSPCFRGQLNQWEVSKAMP